MSPVALGLSVRALPPPARARTPSSCSIPPFHLDTVLESRSNCLAERSIVASGSLALSGCSVSMHASADGLLPSPASPAGLPPSSACLLASAGGLSHSPVAPPASDDALSPPPSCESSLAPAWRVHTGSLTDISSAVACELKRPSGPQRQGYPPPSRTPIPMPRCQSTPAQPGG